jgi:hypothetical protein
VDALYSFEVVTVVERVHAAILRGKFATVNPPSEMQKNVLLNAGHPRPTIANRSFSHHSVNPLLQSRWLETRGFVPATAR